MFERKKLGKLDDYFKALSSRTEKCVYFCRINTFSPDVKNFIERYYEAARKCGVIIERKIANPDEKNLAYYNEIMQDSFELNLEFINKSLKKWLPAMNDFQRQNISASMYNLLENMHKSGKNDNMLKNAYIKFMCWLYYKFERIVNKLGENELPKILYEGTVSKYELMILSVLSGAGCDIVLLQYSGDGDYLKLDPKSEFSDAFLIDNATSFPSDFSLEFIRSEMRKKLETERLYGVSPQFVNCTNAWITGKIFSDILTAPVNRGTDTRFYYNCFCQINGVEDKLTYQSELMKFHSDLQNTGRKFVISEGGIALPSPDEINAVSRRNYPDKETMIAELAAHITNGTGSELRPVIKKAFIDIMLESAAESNMNLGKLTGRAVYIICWFRRYREKLFSGWKFPEISCFIYFGCCKSNKEAAFIRFLSRLPVDVILFNSDLNSQSVLKDKMLYEKNYTDSLILTSFPHNNAEIHIGTAAYHAERELDSIMYQDSGIYRDMQHSRANSVILSTMYEEIAILWNQELKYRPNFNAEGDTVTIPVIFAKVSGVKDGLVPQYWQMIKSLVTEDTLLIKQTPYIDKSNENPVRAFSAEFFKHGKLLKEKIKSHKCYSYGFLREDIQNHIFEKLQLLIDRRLIKGTFENGMEYTIISVILNMDKNILRMIQKFDFAKKNPKIIYINTGENVISAEDAILMSFLSLAGFDVLFFVPTGYRSVENHFNRDILVEHQAGSYVYDLQVPDFSRISSNTRHSWREKLFKRGT